MTNSFATIRPELTAPGRYRLQVQRQNCLGPNDAAKHLSGGAAMAAALRAAEADSGRFVVGAAGRFAGSPGAGDMLELSVAKLSEGRNFSQVTIASESQGKPMLSAHATLAAKAPVAAADDQRLADLPPPEDCPPLRFIVAHPGDQHTLLDVRHCPLADCDLAFWMAVPKHEALDSGALALIADYLPEAVHHKLGRPAGAISFDNVLTIAALTETDWVLGAIQIEPQGRQFHGTMRLHDRSGILLARASQSGLIREFARPD